MPGKKTAGSRRTPTRPTRLSLSTVDQAFALTYLANGENGLAAYLSVHPKAKATTAASNSYKLLRKAQIAAYIDRERRERWKRLQMDGEEVLGRVALDARADLSDLYDDAGTMLPIKQWPAHIRNSIEAIEHRPDGTVKVKLTSKGAARRTLLEQTGKLKSPLEGGISALAKALRGDLGIEEGDL